MSQFTDRLQSTSASIDAPTMTPYPLKDLPSVGGNEVIVVVVFVYVMREVRVLMKDFPPFFHDVAKTFKYLQRPAR
jgi:hypothetical protein